MKTKSEMKRADGWHYSTGQDGWSVAGYPTRDAARAAKKAAKPIETLMPDAQVTQTAMAERADADLKESTKKVVDNAVALEVDSLKTSGPEAITQPASKTLKEQNMTLTFKSISKNGRSAIYGFGRNSVRFALTAFTDKTHPATISVNPSDGSFVEPATPKAQMTAEEKAAAKAARAALPKPTLAERIAKREAQLAKDKAKLAAAGGM